jgi:hypothetical protein
MGIIDKLKEILSLLIFSLSGLFNFVLLAIIIYLILPNFSYSYPIMQKIPVIDYPINLKIPVGILIISIIAYSFSRYFSEIRVMQKDMKIMELSNYFKNVPELCKNCREMMKSNYEKSEKLAINNLDKFEKKFNEKKPPTYLCKDQILSKIEDDSIRESVEIYLDKYNETENFLKHIKEEHIK